MTKILQMRLMAAWGHWWHDTPKSISSSFNVSTTRGERKDGELLDTQIPKRLGWFSRKTLFKKKKVWLNLRAHLCGWVSYMAIASPMNMKGLAIFLHKRAHSERFSIGSPRPSVLRCLNGFVFCPSRHVKRSRGDELFSNKVLNSAPRRILPFLTRQRRIVNLRSSGVQGDWSLQFRPGTYWRRGEREGRRSVGVVSCVKELADWREKGKVLLEMSGISIKILDL